MGGHVQLTDYLVAHNADLRTPDDQGLGALDIARARGHLRCADYITATLAGDGGKREKGENGEQNGIWARWGLTACVLFTCVCIFLTFNVGAARLRCWKPPIYR